jgi:hypothetical protein
MTVYYTELIVPHLQRMLNLEELSLNLLISFVFAHISIFRMKVIFHSKKIFKHFQDNQICSCITDYFKKDKSILYHMYSYPYNFKYCNTTTNHFPGGLFKHVCEIDLHDERPFEHDFFFEFLNHLHLSKYSL